MTTLTAVWLVAALLAALVDWYAVENRITWLEYIAKPKTTTLLLFAALALDPANDAERWWAVAALALCLAGDVFLMLPSDRFVAGLASFLVGHVLFIAGFIAGRNDDPAFWLTVPLAVLAIGASAKPVLQGAVDQDRRLLVPVVAYMTVIATMLANSALTGRWLTIAGAAMFVVSDSVLARHRFVKPFVRGRLATMVTYHAALALLVLALI